MLDGLTRCTTRTVADLYQDDAEWCLAADAAAAWAAKLAAIREAVEWEREALAAAMEPPVTGDPMDDRYLGMARVALDALLVAP